MRKSRWIAIVCMVATLTALTACVAPTEDRVNNALRQEAERLVDDISDATYRNGFRDRDALERTVRLLPDQKIVTRGMQNLHWEGDNLLAVVSFSSSAQQTEAEGSGRYSAISCGKLTINIDEIRFDPIVCPDNIPLEYGSTQVIDYKLAKIEKKVESKWR